MSDNGMTGSARVEIDNGLIGVAGVWGNLRPEREHGIRLSLVSEEPGESDGNIRRGGVKREVVVYLTDEQLVDLTTQLREYQDLAAVWHAWSAGRAVGNPVVTRTGAYTHTCHDSEDDCHACIEDAQRRHACAHGECGAPAR